MKKYIALLSLLIAFSFVSESFGQDDGLTRTTPVISSTGTGSGIPPKTFWKVVFINQNKIVLKLTKSVDCATLKDISAKSEEGEDLSIHYNESDLKNLKTRFEKLITVKFDGNVLNKKVIIGLNWDLSNCDGSIDKGDDTQQSSVLKNQNNLKSTAMQGRQTSVPDNTKSTYSPLDFLYLHFKDKNVVTIESPKLEKIDKN